jgi:transcriptional regulator
MFEFPRFATDDPRHAVDLVRAHPFALVVSANDGVPVGTHVPVIEESPVDTTFVGTTLLGHMAKVNSHWRGFEGSPQVPERRGRVQDEFRSRGNVPLAELMEGVNEA